MYTALNNLVILYTDMLDEDVTEYHAYTSLLNLTIYFTFYLLLLNSNYCITQFFIAPAYFIISCLYAFKTPNI